jgi:hypothetical protein
MPLQDELRAELTSEELTAEWEESVDSMIQDSDRKSQLLDWIRGFSNEFLEILDEIDDPEDQTKQLATQYIRLECNWKLLNTRMQYQAINNGKPDPAIAVKGSLVSTLIATLEDYLDQRIVESIDSVLSEPMSLIHSEQLKA